MEIKKELNPFKGKLSTASSAKNFLSEVNSSDAELRRLTSDSIKRSIEASEEIGLELRSKYLKDLEITHSNSLSSLLSFSKQLSTNYDGYKEDLDDVRSFFSDRNLSNLIQKNNQDLIRDIASANPTNELVKELSKGVISIQDFKTKAGDSTELSPLISKIDKSSESDEIQKQIIGTFVQENSNFLKDLEETLRESLYEALSTNNTRLYENILSDLPKELKESADSTMELVSQLKASTTLDGQSAKALKIQQDTAAKNKEDQTDLLLKTIASQKAKKSASGKSFGPVNSFSDLGSNAANSLFDFGADMWDRKGGGVRKGAKGLWGKTKGFLKSGAGKLSVGGLVGGVALDYAGDKLKESGHEKLGAGADIGSSALSGAGIGAMIGSVVPVVGTAVGGAVGGAIGGLYGLATNWDTLFKEDSKATQKNLKEEKENLEDQEGFFKGIGNTIAGWGSKAWTAAKDTKEAVVKKTGEVVDATVKKTGEAVDGAKKIGGEAWQGTKDITKSGIGWLSSKFESGGNYADVSKDNIGYAMGKYQINTTTGKDQHEKLVSQFPELAKAASGGFESKEYQQAWKDLAKGDKKKDFEQAQEDLALKGDNTKRAFSSAKDKGLNVENNATIQAALVSSAQQYGGGGTNKILAKAFKDKDAKSMSDEDQLNAIYDTKMDLVDSNFTEKRNGANTEKVRSQQRDRIKKEREAALQANAEEKKKSALEVNEEKLPPLVAMATGQGTQEAPQKSLEPISSDNRQVLAKEDRKSTSSDTNSSASSPVIHQTYNTTSVVQPAFQVTDPFTQAMSF